MKKTYETGLQGEKTAAEYLIHEKHMKFLEQRYRTKSGEIDLIMLDHDTIVFVEVKTRKKGEPGSGLSAVNKNKQNRIYKAAMIYLMKHSVLNHPIRFDLIEINMRDIIYIPNAFQPGGLFFH